MYLHVRDVWTLLLRSWYHFLLKNIALVGSICKFDQTVFVYLCICICVFGPLTFLLDQFDETAVEFSCIFVLLLKLLDFEFEYFCPYWWWLRFILLLHISCILLSLFWTLCNFATWWLRVLLILITWFFGPKCTCTWGRVGSWRVFNASGYFGFL